MGQTLQLILKDRFELRDISGPGQALRLDWRSGERVADRLGEDRNEMSSLRHLDLIRKACVSMSLVVKEDTKRVGYDRRRYLFGATAADIIDTFSASTASATAMVVLLRAISASLQQWLKNRGARSVRLRMGNKTVEIKGSRDIGAAVKALSLLEKVPSERNAKKGLRKKKTHRKS
jgi:hypothetical protein